MSDDRITHTVKPCTSIDEAARHLAVMARFTGKEVIADFNGVEIFAVPGVIPEMVVEHYDRMYYVRHPENRAIGAALTDHVTRVRFTEPAYRRMQQETAMAEQSTALTRIDAPQRLVVHDPVAVFDTGKFELMQRIATLMARSTLVPETLRKGDPAEALANCFLVVGQAQRWGMDPFAVAQSVSVIHGKLCYEGKLVAAVLAAKLGVRLRYEWNGRSGDAMGITVSGVLDGQTLNITGTVGDWKTTGPGTPWKPSQYQKMLAYRGAREWARLYAPEVMLGVSTPDEMSGVVDHVRDAGTVDITPAAPSVAHLPAPTEEVRHRAPTETEAIPATAGPADDGAQLPMALSEAEPDDMSIIIRDAIAEAGREKDPAKRRAMWDALPREQMTDEQVGRLRAAFEQMELQAGKSRGKAA